MQAFFTWHWIRYYSDGSDMRLQCFAGEVHGFLCAISSNRKEELPFGSWCTHLYGCYCLYGYHISPGEICRLGGGKCGVNTYYGKHIPVHTVTGDVAPITNGSGGREQSIGVSRCKHYSSYVLGHGFRHENGS